MGRIKEKGVQGERKGGSSLGKTREGASAGGARSGRGKKGIN